MFLRNSRYQRIRTAEALDRMGRTVTAMKLRRLPPTAGASVQIGGEDKLDIQSEQRYGDPTRYWHIADANTELVAEDLVATAGRVIQVPES